VGLVECKWLVLRGEPEGGEEEDCLARVCVENGEWEETRSLLWKKRILSMWGNPRRRGD